MPSRYLTVKQSKERYGPSEPAWRRWISKGLLGDAVCRFGRLVMIDSFKIDERLQQTGQLLSSDLKKR